MPRANLKEGHEAQEIGAAIVAAWFKVLPTAVPIENITFAIPLVRQDQVAGISSWATKSG